MSIPRARIAGLRQTRQPDRIGSLCLCSGGRQKTGSLRNRTPPCYLPIKPTGATRGKMRNQSLKRSPHAHNPSPNPFQKACFVTQRSQSCNYTTTARLLIGPSAALSRAPAHVYEQKIYSAPDPLLMGDSTEGLYSYRSRKATARAQRRVILSSPILRLRCRTQRAARSFALLYWR